MRLSWVIVCLAGTLGLAAVCGAPRDGASTPAPLTVADVQARIAAAMARDGHVLHTTIVTSAGLDRHAYATTTDAWVDAASGRARSDVTTAFLDGTYVRQATKIVEGDALYLLRDGGSAVRNEARVCRGAASAAISAVLECRGFLEASVTRIGERERYAGRDAISLITSGTVQGYNEVTSFTDRLYIDAATYLPLALVSDGSVDDGVAHPFRTESRYAHEFVPASMVSAGHFDPASIGWTPRAVSADAVDAGIAVGGLPRLQLASTFVADEAMQPYTGVRSERTYIDAARPFGAPALIVREWPLDAWAGHEAATRDRMLPHARVDGAVLVFEAAAGVTIEDASALASHLRAPGGALTVATR